jgi:tetratricopeptide (TPR) repeat protein
MPSHVNAHLNLGSILFDKGDIDSAAKHYLKSLNSGEDAHEAYYRLGLCYKKMGKIKQAVAAFESAIKRKANRGEIYFNFGMIYYDNKELHYKAEELFKLAIKKKPDYAEAHLYLGNIYYKKRMLSEAMDQYKEAIDLKEDYAIAYSNLGAVYNDLNMLDKSRHCYFKAIEMNVNLAEAHLNLGVLYQKQRDYEQAIKEMKIYMNLSDGKDVEEIRKRIGEMEKKV